MQSSKLGMGVSQTKTGKDQSETAVGNEVLRAVIEKIPYNTGRDYTEELGVSPITISRHLILIGKVKKKLINGFLIN